MDPRSQPSIRRSLRIRGIVQAVGFRPAVHRLATSLQLGGLVRNESGSVWIEVEGGPERIDRFLADLPRALPAPARIDALELAELPPCNEASFRIDATAPGPSSGANEFVATIPADLAPCDRCLLEFADSADRRHRYPFVNCTACGPRDSIVLSLPYDRGGTTMRPFALCADCLREYEDPADRRFHAEANSCPACGPRLSFLPATEAGDGFDDELHGIDPLAAAIDLLLAGGLLAVKGAGGFALACDASNGDSIARLRRRKRREHKPFAVMAPDLALLESIAWLDESERAALLSPARPIVLVRMRPGAAISSLVAPGLAEIGVFLPPTPLQLRLLQGGPPLLVMTSGNRSREPLAASNAEAQENLAGIADGILQHDRAISVRADDSVLRMVREREIMIRRARGFVPDPLRLPIDGPPLLAVGAGEKNTICLAAGGRAFLSAHLGELDQPAVFALFVETIERLSRIHAIQPLAIAHDLHPDFRSTRWALASGLPCIAVQHHHAHIASCLVENGRTEPVIGVAFDGSGLGEDGTIRGGEFLLADLHSFRRLAHLRPIALAGGDAAIRAPWRLALAALLDAGEEDDLLAAVDRPSRRVVQQLIENGSAPLSSGAGRWFDAAAALCGLRHQSSYEGQAASELEAAASSLPPQRPYGFSLVTREQAPTTIDLRQTIREIAGGLRAGDGVPMVAARFHATLAAIILAGCRRARADGAPPVVALAGGCFQNRRLVGEAMALLEADGFDVLRNRHAPPGDGGIALGQAAIASWRLTHAAPGS